MPFYKTFKKALNYSPYNFFIIMKNLLALLLCTLLFTLLITSCDKDDIEDNQSIIGTWQHSQTIINELEGEKKDIDISELYDRFGDLTFYENGTYKNSGKEIYEWKIINDGKTLKLTNPTPDPEDLDSDPSEYYQFELKDNKLIIHDLKVNLYNKDIYPEEGTISFSEFEKEFNIHLDRYDDIYTPGKYIFIRK